MNHELCKMLIDDLCCSKRVLKLVRTNSVTGTLEIMNYSFLISTSHLDNQKISTWVFKEIFITCTLTHIHNISHTLNHSRNNFKHFELFKFKRSMCLATLENFFLLLSRFNETKNLRWRSYWLFTALFFLALLLVNKAFHSIATWGNAFWLLCKIIWHCPICDIYFFIYQTF